MPNRRIALASASALAIVSLSAACLPSRDNPNEPARRPIADLVVINVPSLPEADCQPPSAWPDVDHVETTGAAERGTCVGLDARRSRDPRGRPLAFTFRAPDGTVLTSPTDGIATISIAMLHSLSINSAHTFSVVVDNHDNPPTTATAELIVEDQPPTLTIDANRTLPVGGFPWSLGSAFQVAFHAHGSDPDHGDDASLRYCWTVPPAPQACDQPADIVRAVSPTAGRFVVTALADDGARQSTAAALEILRVADANLWGQGSYAHLQRMDSERHGWSTSAAMESGALFDDGVAPPLVAAVGFNADSSVTTEVRQWPDLVPVSGGVQTIPYTIDTTPTYGAKIGADPAGRRLWIAGLDEPASKKFRPTLFAYSVAADGTLATAVPLATPFPPETTGVIEESLTQDLGAVDGAGNGWQTRSYGFNVYAMTPQATAYVMPLPNLGLGMVTEVQGLAARPGSNETWVLGRFAEPAVTQTPPTAPGFLWRLAGPGDTGVAFPLEDLVVSGLAFVDHDRAWTYSDDRGLVLLDVAAMEQGVDESAATLLDFPEPFLAAADGIVVDRATGDARVRDDVSGVTWTAHLDGSLGSTVGAATPMFVDANGLTWDVTGNIGAMSFQGGEGTSSDGALFRSSSTVANASAYDWNTGGAWTAFFDPATQNQLLAGYTFVDESGLAERTFTTMSVAGAIRRPPTPYRIRESVDGSLLWAMGVIIGGNQAGTPNEIWTLDLSTDPPTGRLALASNARYRKALDPLTSDPHEAWTINLAFTPGVASLLTLLGDDGSDTTVFTVPLTEYNPGAGNVVPVGRASRGSDKMCLATIDSSTTATHWRRISTAGVVEDLDSFSTPASYSYPLVSAAKGAVDDDCFFVLHDSGGSGSDYVYGLAGPQNFTRYWGETESPIVSIATPSPRLAFVGLANGHHYRLDWSTDTGFLTPAVATSLGSSEVTDFASY